jgi:hypothetical protein
MKEVKEVKEFSKEVKKDDLLGIVFLSLSAGKTTKQICSDLKISKQRLQYYLGKLVSQSKIKKIGYGVWQTSKNIVGSSVRGHGFQWHIKTKEITKWKEILTRKNIKFEVINNGNTFQFYFKDNKIWLSTNSVVVYDIKSYFGFNAVDSKKYAMSNLQTFLNELQAKLGVNLQINDKYILKTSRQHYALIRNSLAIQCREDGTKINVYNERGLWFTIDNSFNLEEAETVHPDTALIDNLGVQKFFNEHKETKWEVTPKWTKERVGECLGMISQVTSNQVMFNQNFESHVKSVQSLGHSAEANAKSVELLSDVILQLRDEVVNLKKEISSLKNSTTDLNTPTTTD